MNPYSPYLSKRVFLSGSDKTSKDSQISLNLAVLVARLVGFLKGWYFRASLLKLKGKGVLEKESELRDVDLLVGGLSLNLQNVVVVFTHFKYIFVL